MKASGIIAGDDWNPNHQHKHHGVYKAVKDFVDKERYKMIYKSAANNQWAIKTMIDYQ